MMVDDDQEFVEQTLRGDRKAFERLVDKYQKLVFNLALNMSRDSEDAADITQSVFLKVYQKLYTFDPKYKFFSWLYRIAVNESLNLVKKQERSEGLDVGALAAEDYPDGEVRSDDVARSVQDALLELEVNHRAVIVLRHFHDLSYGEIAQILDISENKVKSRLFSARALLRTICKRRGIA